MEISFVFQSVENPVSHDDLIGLDGVFSFVEVWPVESLRFLFSHAAVCKDPFSLLEINNKEDTMCRTLYYLYYLHGKEANAHL